MKKKIVALASTITYLFSVSKAYADETINITKPPVGYSDLGLFITNIIRLAFGIGVLVVLVMIIWGAFEWISSGGDKEAVGKARGRILNAIIGLAVLAVTFALFDVAAKFLGFGGFDKIIIPTPSSSPNQ